MTNVYTVRELRSKLKEALDTAPIQVRRGDQLFELRPIVDNQVTVTDKPRMCTHCNAPLIPHHNACLTKNCKGGLK